MPTQPWVKTGVSRLGINLTPAIYGVFVLIAVYSPISFLSLLSRNLKIFQNIESRLACCGENNYSSAVVVDMELFLVNHLREINLLCLRILAEILGLAANQEQKL
jgi:hypothetical protein